MEEASPAPSTVVPRAPPTTPATPKREIKLVTAGSSAADWFTHGFVGITSKDTNPPLVTEPPSVKVEPLSPEKFNVQHDFINHEEPLPCIEGSEPVPITVAETTTTSLKCTILYGLF